MLHPPTLRAPISASQLKRLQLERTQQVYALALYGQPLGVAAAAVLALGLWVSGGPHWLGAWVGALLAVLAWEARIAMRYLKSDAESRSDKKWERALAYACFASGLLWAVLPGFIGSVRPALEIVLVIALVGIGTATLGALAVSTAAFQGYAMPPLLALVAAYALRGGVENWTLACLVAVYIVFLVAAQRAVAAQFIERVMTQLRNDDLVGRLTDADTALKSSLAEHQLLFDLATVGIAEIRDRRIVRTNSQLEQMLGYPADALIGQPVTILYPPDTPHERFSEIRDPIARGLTIERDMQVARRDGSLLWVALTGRAVDPDRAGSPVIAVFSDITDRREREAAMQRLAHEDALTGLPNRRLLEDRLRHALARARRHGGCVAVLLIDLDGFKRINDNHGHEAGDQVLARVAQRLLGCVRANDTVSRIGGDEFVVLLDDPLQTADAERIAQKLVAVVAEPVLFGAHQLRVGASVGISVAPQDSLDAEVLLRCADEAMYRAKESGRGAWRHYADGTPAS